MENIFNSLVRIQTQGYQYNWIEPFKPIHETNGIGTGFFINNKGYILTCAHVIDESLKILVSIPSSGQEKYEANVISFYPEMDIAVIKINDYKQKINYLKLGDSDKIIPGEDVVAVGYPLGQDKLKITKGIISGRETGLIQTDTPLNPGNSGGPLLRDNKVIGINSSAYKSEDAENVGFSIPINTFKNISKILTQGSRRIVFQASIGCSIYNSNHDIMNYYNCKGCKNGVIIHRIMENSELNKHNIIKGDILCKINNYDIDNYGECKVEWNIEKVPFKSLLERFNVGDKIKLKIWSQEKKKIKDIIITLKPSIDIYQIREKYPPFDIIKWELFGGLLMVELTLNHIYKIPSLFEYMKPEKRNKNKILITKIYPGSSLSKDLILVPGDLIKSVNDKKVYSIEDVRKAIMNPIINRNIEYIKFENEENKVSITPMKKAIQENIFLSKNYNYPITKLNEDLIQTNFKKTDKKNTIKKISKQKKSTLKK